MLLSAGIDSTEVAVENASVWVYRHAEAKVAAAVVVVAIEPGAVVDVWV